ncbi:Non-structural maintenance of chromosomes element 1-like protein [Trichoplax sp. H2]|nr:Non-structural maintenance of chromosomes element 1-like protein [Trichoplax sp. H2]|eukprot:RDD41338.1 Non-structural maintenance of chromosomes element 1-like protein [Trichoplax sp. H2]
MVNRKLLQLSLQSLMAHGCLEEKETKALIQKCCQSCEENFSNDIFRSIIKEINTRIKKFSFEIRHGACEDDDGQVYYCYVNTKEDNHAKLATFYSVNELVFFNSILEQVVASPDGLVIENTILQAREQFTARAAQRSLARSLSHLVKEFLDRLVCDKWLSRTEDKEYHLGPRSLLDLLPFLQNRINSICSICSSLAIRAQQCPSCLSKAHVHCLSRLASGRNFIKCPRCDEDWKLKDCD